MVAAKNEVMALLSVPVLDAALVFGDFDTREVCGGLVGVRCCSKVFLVLFCSTLLS